MKLTANQIRRNVLKMVYEKQSGHIGGSFSIAEVVACLYNNFKVKDHDQDKLILSKGHAVPALYAALYSLGVLNDEDLELFREINSPLQGHPDKLKLKYMHATTGSLGQGLSIAIGHALGMKLKNSNNKVFCIVGDGEMQEGQVWEALMLAPKYKLDNICCLIDANGSQNDGSVEDILSLHPLDKKILAFGWKVVVINGNSYEQVEKKLNNFSMANDGIPTCIILNTTKGSGVSFMQTPSWHAKVPNAEEYAAALEELKSESD